MGKAKRFNAYDSDVEQQRKLVKSYGEIRQANSVTAFRTMAKSAPTATNTDNESVVVTSSTVADNSITFAKIQDIATMKVIGRTATGTGDPSEISILDEDDMASDSAVALATQQSIKAYVDANGGSTSFVGFTADNDLSMGTYNIDGVDQLLFSTATSSDSPVWNVSNYGFEIAGGTTPTALDIRVPTGKFVNVKIAGTTEFEFKSNELDVNDNDICNVGTIFTDYISKSSGNDNVRVWGHLNPISNNAYDLGTNSLKWKDLYLSGNLQVDGNTTLADSAGDSITFNGLVNFANNYSAVSQTAGNSTGYITILIGGSAKKLYYY